MSGKGHNVLAVSSARHPSTGYLLPRKLIWQRAVPLLLVIVWLSEALSQYISLSYHAPPYCYFNRPYKIILLNFTSHAQKKQGHMDSADHNMHFNTLPTPSQQFVFDPQATNAPPKSVFQRVIRPENLHSSTQTITRGGVGG